MGFLFALILITVSLFPSSVNLLRSMLAMENQQFSRLIALSILSNVTLWLLLIYTRIQRSNLDIQFDLLVREQGVREFDRLYPKKEALPPIVVLIPAYNEAENIGLVLDGMPDDICGKDFRVILIDDGSDDLTADTAREKGALAIRCPINRGQGAALKIGFDIVKRRGVDIVVTMDADGQHLPSEIERLVAPVLANEFDFMIGSRVLGESEKKQGAVRAISIRFFSAVIRILTPARISDCANGFRALRARDLTRVQLRQDQFQNSELIIDAARKSVRIGEAPVTIKARLGGRSKKGNALRYGLGFARTILRSWWR